MPMHASPDMNCGADRPTAAAARLGRRARGFGSAFRRDESGVMIAYSLFFFLIMLIVGGIGVDFMHYEMSRTRLQNTLDRAVLAAADLQQELDPASVVEDYLSKAGIDATLTGTPTVNAGLNYRDVAANATLDVPTQFIHMLGFDKLVAPAGAKAEERIEGVEISLVLDISNSMNSNNRLVNLKPAAREFIDAVMALAEHGDVSVSLIPYNTQVNAGKELLSHYAVTMEGPSDFGGISFDPFTGILTGGAQPHDYSHCVNFQDADFNSPALSTTDPLEQTMHFDYFTYYDPTDPTDWNRAAQNWPPQADEQSRPSFPPTGWEMPIPVCPTWDGTAITPWSVNDTELKNRIDGLVANGNTSIDVAMKWATALLDPGTQPVVTAMIADGQVDPLAAALPRAYDAQDVLKVIVVMTDGQNTNQYMMPDDMRTTLSDVYFDPPSGNFSIYYQGRLKYYWPHDNTWNNKAYGNTLPGVGTAVRLSYQELFAWVSAAQNAWYLYGAAEQSLGAGGRDRAWAEWYSNLTEKVDGATKDNRLQRICQAAKDNEVVVYTIGFEATANGNAQLRNCATSPGHFYTAAGTNITDVFQAIAVSITQLRLTQ